MRGCANVLLVAAVLLTLALIGFICSGPEPVEEPLVGRVISTVGATTVTTAQEIAIGSALHIEGGE